VTRCLTDQPDVVVTHLPAICTGCGAALEGVPALAKPERLRVIELPEPSPVITGHQAVHKACPHCQTVTAASFPLAVTQPVQYGPRVKAVAVSSQT
jgi:transposase